MDTRAKDRREDGQRGSVTVFVALLLPTLALMIFLVLNIGQLVFEKIRLQNTADACALSAAAVQAAGLNEIAELNFWSSTYVINLVRGVMGLTIILAPWQNQMTADSAVNFYKGVFSAIRDYQDKANKDYAKKALSIAKATKRANLDDRGVTGVRIESMNPRADFDNPKNLIEYRKHKTTVPYSTVVSTGQYPYCIFQSNMTWNDAAAGDKKYFGLYLGWMTPPTCVLVVMPGFAEFDYKISKKSKPMTYSAFKLTQEAKDFVIAGSVFGRMDKMTAYAAAMPTGGNVKSGKPKYKPVLVRLDKLDPKPTGSLDKVLH
ncbi:MAG: Tad domain-containing protein [Desulfovibrionaceae bacterium]|nr:Tad domain-containing protein [Desulfovibrionaceae bacterium]